MQSWYFSEQSYYPAWNLPGSPKIDSPSAPVDPEIAHRLLQEYIEQCKLCDSLGLNIMANEHHATYTCMNVSCLMTLGIIASHTKNARLLALGVPVMSRMDPYRIAEEIAYVDTLSRGRLELGLIKGTAFELYISNSHPVTAPDRYWEAHDLIVAALGTTQLVRLDIEGYRVVGEERLMSDQGRIRDVTQAPDGALYLLVDDGGKVLRVTPQS